MQIRRIVLGEIAGPHGLDGEVRVRCGGDTPEHLLAADAVWLGRRPGDPEARRVVVRASGTGRGGEVRLRLEGVEGREAARALVGRLVMVPSDVLPTLPEGEFYWYELIGCRVESESGEVAGVVREIWEAGGAHDVLLIEDADGVRRLVPTVREIMQRVDLEAGLIVVADLPGLLEPC